MKNATRNETAEPACTVCDRPMMGEDDRSEENPSVCIPCDANEHENTVNQLLGGAGFRFEPQLGGGCTGWALYLEGSESYLLITNEDGGSAPDRTNEPCLVGFYSPDHEDGVYCTTPCVVDAIQAAKLSADAFKAATKEGKSSPLSEREATLVRAALDERWTRMNEEIDARDPDDENDAETIAMLTDELKELAAIRKKIRVGC